MTRSWPAPWPARSNAVPGPQGEEPERELVGATDRPVVLTGGVEDASVTVDRRALEARARKGPAHHRAYLDLEDVDAAANPGVVYAVYVNLPEHPSAEQLASHHVGNLSLFGVERARDPRGDTHAHRLRVSMEITDVLDRLADTGEWHDGERIDVTFRRLGLEDPEDPPEDDDDEAVAPSGDAVDVGRISVHYA